MTMNPSVPLRATARLVKPKIPHERSPRYAPLREAELIALVRLFARWISYQKHRAPFWEADLINDKMDPLHDQMVFPS